jgi:hypothetical protein
MVDAPADLVQATDQVLEAVFRYQIQQAGAGKDEVICLRVRTRGDGETKMGDASPALLSRFQTDFPRARKGSDCRARKGEPAVEIATGARALILDIGPVDFRGGDQAVVEGGFSRGGFDTRLDEFEVAQEGGAWKVKKSRLKLIT